MHSSRLNDTRTINREQRVATSDVFLSTQVAELKPAAVMKKTSFLSPVSDSRLLRYSSVAGASLLGATTAHANIAYTNPDDIILTRGEGGFGIMSEIIDLDGNGVNDVEFLLSYDSAPYVNDVGLIQNGFGVALGRWLNETYSDSFRSWVATFTSTGSGTTYIYPRRLETGAYIGFEQFFTTYSTLAVNGFGFAGGEWFGNQGPAFLGFQIQADESTFFGWVQAEVQSSPTGIPEALIIYDWAYNMVSGDPINAGEIPEPAHAVSGLGLLALGAAGVARYRRRKAEKAAEANG